MPATPPPRQPPPPTPTRILLQIPSRRAESWCRGGQGDQMAQLLKRQEDRREGIGNQEWRAVEGGGQIAAGAGGGREDGVGGWASSGRVAIVNFQEQCTTNSCLYKPLLLHKHTFAHMFMLFLVGLILSHSHSLSLTFLRTHLLSHYHTLTPFTLTHSPLHPLTHSFNFTCVFTFFTLTFFHLLYHSLTFPFTYSLL